MHTNLPASVLENIKEPFQRILSIENFGDPVNEVADLIGKGRLDGQTLAEVFNRYRLKDFGPLKPQVLDLILSYARLVLSDHVITASEAENVKFLKRFFRIKEGDFYSAKYHDIESIIDRQLERMLQNDDVDNNEALQKVDLQDMFDLSYDQFLKLTQKAVTAAIDRGADPMNLDTFLKSN